MIKLDGKAKKIAPFVIVAAALIAGFVLDRLHETRFRVEKMAPGEVNNFELEVTAPPARLEQGRININTASAEELAMIDGIGEGLAGRIVEYREKNGDFVNTNELMNVSGIGEKTLEQIENDICVE
ncbi:MAG: helix-hairpin-helix domain-containing protein [Clostridia bacterium]|nr:helix-hairpin-helix domain-containing protein [Clostridia bacterium]